MNYLKLNKGRSGLMCLAGIKYREWRHNNRESSVNLLLNGTVVYADLTILFLEPEWAIDSEPMRARGMIYCFSKIQLAETKQLKLVKSFFLPPKSQRSSLLVGYNI